MVLGLVLSPIIGLVSGVLWYELGGKNSGGIVAFIAGIATFGLIVWKSGNVFEKILGVLRATLPKPISSCIEFGVAASFVVGGVMAATILLLGHTRPEGLDFDRIPLAMGVGFVCGLPLGFLRKNGASS